MFEQRTCVIAILFCLIKNVWPKICPRLKIKEVLLALSMYLVNLDNLKLCFFQELIVEHTFAYIVVFLRETGSSVSSDCAVRSGKVFGVFLW